MTIITHDSGEFIKPRILLIKFQSRIQYKFKFDGAILTDSEALHEMFSQMDPGNTYSASFRNGR